MKAEQCSVGESRTNILPLRSPATNFTVPLHDRREVGTEVEPNWARGEGVRRVPGAFEIEGTRDHMFS
jgi:hypothetical protein